MATQPTRYRSPDEDSGRWRALPLRQGDIVISTRSKSGTTWMQMLCALLIFDGDEFPAPLTELSPWLDWVGEPIEELVRRLEAQDHRRFIKTHTPLDGVPNDERVTYIVVGRHPLDMATSLYHQGDNLDQDRMRALLGESESPAAAERPAKLTLDAWLRNWIDWDGDPAERLDSLPGVMWHLNDVWGRRDDPNVLLFHYDELLADLPGQLGRLASGLGIDLDTTRIEELAAAAGFDRMKSRSEELAPNPGGVLKETGAFFRGGRSGAGREALRPEDVDRYEERAAELAGPELLAWLHRSS